MTTQQLARVVQRAIADDAVVRHELLAVAREMARRREYRDLLMDLRDAIDPLHNQRAGSITMAEIAAVVGIALIADGK